MVAAKKEGPLLWERAIWRYRLYQCLHYAAPADRVICTEIERGAGGALPTLTRIEVEPSATSIISGSWIEPPSAEPLLFMHERRTKSGRRRLVIVRRTTPAVRSSLDLPVSYSVWVNDVDGSAGGTISSIIEVLPHPFDSESPTSLRFFAGQPDRVDESHFTIGYEANGRRGIIDGRLLDARPGDFSDRVELEDRGLIGG